MLKPRLSLASALLLTTTLLTTACGSKDPQPTPASTTLYTRMGGKTAMEGVTDQLVANISAEIGQGPTLSKMERSHRPMLDAISSQNGQPATDPTRLQRLRNNVVDQFTDITGGPLKYTGKSMLVAHTGMGVTNAEYTVWRGLLDNSLTTNKVSAADKAQFTALIDAMKGDVVNH